MNLREFQAKEIFAGHGIVVPAGRIAATTAEVRKIAQDIGQPVVLKPQLGFKKRGKLGLISFCENPEDAQNTATSLFGLTVEGEKIETILVEKRAETAQELYLAVTIDYSRRCPVILLSCEGGVDIEEFSGSGPGKLLTLPTDIFSGPTVGDLATIATFAGVDVAGIASKVYSIFRTYDAEIVEINPLVRTKDGKLVAVDAVLNVNDDAIYRQPEIAAFKQRLKATQSIADEAAGNNWTYIDLPGDIAILSSGAGLAMAILDLIHFSGSSAANFLDTAQIDEDGIYRAFSLLAKAKDARAMLINIFAGLNRCDRLAEGIVTYLKEHPYDKPIVVRMIGNKEETGHRILRDFGIEPYRDLEDAVERVVELTNQQSS